MSQIHARKKKSKNSPNFFVKKKGEFYYFLILKEKTLIANVFKSKMLPIFI
jgi:hypothetical protein